ncbi:MAG: serine/threonine-protein kinase [Polyangiales bacterium]
MTDNLEPMREGEIVGGRFVIEALAGTGGMGTVYRARDRRTDALVAVKVLAENGSDTRFEHEARVLAELSHPAIVGYVAHGRVGERPFLAMEWLDGEDLRTHLARGRISVESARIVARRVSEALAAAHARSIVHRDIKPGNLFLVGGDPSRIKVLDFGIARTRIGKAYDTTAVPITRTGMVIGTVGYMSPEQARGSHEVDARADVFALGCVLFECITGKPAFSGPNAVAVLARVLLEEAPRTRHFEASVPPQLDELVARMLAKDPAARPRDAVAVLRALETSEPSRANGSSGGVGDREQRLVTIVLARGVEAPIEGALSLEGGAKLLEFGGQDPATAAAARALAIAREHPQATIAIATGRVTDAHAGAYGPIIDRLATLAPRARGIAIDEVSATLLGDRFEIVDGALIGASRNGASPRTLLGKRTPYVGRDKELALLDATLRECISEPVARAMVVTGSAGSGKTRLAHELLGRVRGDAKVLIARGDPVGAGSALGLARQLVRNAAGLREGDAPHVQHAMLRAHLEELFTGGVLARAAEMLGELVAAPPAEPSPQLRAARDDARALASWLSRSFAEWIAAMSDAGPLLCVIEDLHWGDGASVAYLDEALRANEARPLMVLALSRPEVHDLFPQLWARAGMQEIKLQALTRRAGEKLIKSVLGQLDDASVGRIVERADGNAFHLEELIRHVAERGVDSLPETVLALAESRIARLDAECRRLLRVASMFGETFWEQGVASLLGPDGNALEVLPRLVEQEVVVLSAGRKFAGEYQFRHGLLRDAAYAMLTDDDRKQLHAHAAGWLESAGEKDALILAEHFERAGDRERAAPCFVRAAKQAIESWNVTAARALAERGFRSGATGETLGELRLVQATSGVMDGQHRLAVAAAKEAYGLLSPRSPHWYAAAAYLLSSGAYVGDVELAPAIIQTMLTTSPIGRPTGAYGWALSTSADILDSIGQHTATEALVARAEELWRTVETDPAFRGFVSYARVAMLLRRDHDLGDLQRIGREGTALMEEAADPIGINLFKFGNGTLLFEAGDTSGARALLEQTLRQVGDAPLFGAWCAIHLGWCDFFDGRFDETIAQARRAYEHDPHHAYALAAFAHLEKGDRSEAERLIARALDGIDEKLVTPWVVAYARAIAARIALDAGRIEEATRLSNSAVTVEGCPPLGRSLIDRIHLDVLRARGEDHRPPLERFLARIERHSASLPPERRAAYRATRDHAYVLELAQR